MQVQVRYFLQRVLSFIDYQSISLTQMLLLGYLGGSYEEFAENGLVLVLCLGDTSQSVLLFGDDEDMRGRNWCNIPEGEDVIVLEHSVNRYLFLNNHIEDGWVIHIE